LTPDLARADRAAAVRGAARSWQRAGMIDTAALAAVESHFPDDRVRVGPVFRVLLFLFTAIAVLGFFGFFAISAGAGHDGVLAALALAVGVALAATTEILIGPLRRRQGGVEAASSLLAIGFLVGAAAWVLLQPGSVEMRQAWPILCAAGAVLAGAAAWRWGYPIYAGAGTAAALVALAHLPAGRALWIALPLAAAPVLLRLSESPRLPPAHRSSSTAVLLVALAGLYLAVHLGSWENQLVESLGGRGFLTPASPPPAGPVWTLAAAATALLPIALLALGLRRRRLPLALAGTVAAVASLVTLHRYVDLGPAWLALTVGGASGIAAALGLWRYLESGPGEERHGFTAAPLATDRERQRLVEVGAALLTLRAEDRPPGAEQSYTAGGGRSGGGGASGEF
jgi:hypothetical protein